VQSAQGSKWTLFKSLGPRPELPARYCRKGAPPPMKRTRYLQIQRLNTANIPISRPQTNCAIQETKFVEIIAPKNCQFTGKRTSKSGYFQNKPSKIVDLCPKNIIKKSSFFTQKPSKNPIPKYKDWIVRQSFESKATSPKKSGIFFYEQDTQQMRWDVSAARRAAFAASGWEWRFCSLFRSPQQKTHTTHTPTLCRSCEAFIVWVECCYFITL
jgi:hypothetical protein